MTNHVRQVRMAQGLTLNGLSYAARVPACQLSQIERDLVPCWPAARRRLAAALGVTEATLFPEGEGASVSCGNGSRT